MFNTAYTTEEVKDFFNVINITEDMIETAEGYILVPGEEGWEIVE